MKKIFLTVIQIAITSLLLWLMFRDPAKRAEMAGALRTADFFWLIPGIASIGLAHVLQTERWRILMKVQGIDMAWWRAFRVFLSGAFFNLFLPGGTGGDVLKIYYAMRETASKKSAAFLSVLIDRMMGLIAMAVVAAVLCSFRLQLIWDCRATQDYPHPQQTLFAAVNSGHAWTWLKFHPPQTLTLLLAAILGASLALIVTGFLVDRFHLAKKLPSWLPLHGKIIELSAAFSTYARSPGVLAQAFGLSLPAHLFNFLAFYFAARAFGIFQGFSGFVDVFAVLPIIMTIASLPISMAGLGVREELFKNVFGPLFDTDPGIATMISLTGFSLVVFWGLVGGLVYLTYRPSGGLHLTEVEKEVEEIGQSIEKEA